MQPHDLVLHYDDLLRFVMRDVRCRHEAQDLVHQVFERVLAMHRAGRAVENLGGLLRQAARNLVIDRHRRERLRDHVGDEALLELPGPQAHEPEVALTAKRRAQSLLVAIEALPPRCREAFVLHKFEGLPHAEVAVRMGVTVNMVEKHVMQAVAACRLALVEPAGG